MAPNVPLNLLMYKFIASKDKKSIILSYQQSADENGNLKPKTKHTIVTYNAETMAIKSEIDLMKALVLEEMSKAMPLPNNVPVVAEVGIGNNWLEAH